MTGEPLPDEAVHLLNALLGDAYPELSAQIPHLRVAGHCRCPCPSIDFALDRSAVPAAPAVDSPFAEATVLDETGEPVGGVMLFASEGYLSLLEVYSWSDDPVTRLPSPDRLA
ncbi:hypothetical protein ACFV4F_42375 [Kitasatospora sp. NPDC059722]|uniref:hypothetical protein n=1 Tax=Kitasatospora sp. NPDC059722 TaxID=3346925 RepID=UPI003688F8A4